MSIVFTAPPPAPTRTNPANFNSQAEALVAWLSTLVSEFNAVEAADYFSILGTVSQSGGVPTGSLFQKGSNANGRFVRFADGTQICWNETGFAPVDCNVAAGNVFRSNLVTWTYPAAFSHAPTAFVGSTNVATSAWGSVGEAVGSLTSVGMCMFAPVSTLSLDFKPAAVGRWF